MTDTDKTDDQDTELLASAMVHVPGRGLVVMSQEKLVEGMARLQLQETHMAPCFIIRGADQGKGWIHFYSAVVGQDVTETLRNEGTVTVPLSFKIQGGGALVIEHQDDGFVRAYGPGTWERIYRFNEDFMEMEGGDSPSGE